MARTEDITGVVQGLRRIVRALESYSREVLKSYGLTAPQLWAVKTLQRAGPISVNRLAEMLVVHQASASLLVTRLEARGLVQRTRSAKDRRVVELSLTAAGKALARRAPEPAQGRLLHRLAAMPTRDLRGIHVAIERLVAAMEAQDVKATFFFQEE